jgi:hypothetical protein
MLKFGRWLDKIIMPSDRNVMQEESGNKLEHKNLRTEIHLMWNIECFVIPVIIGSTGIATKKLNKYLEAIQGKHSTHSLKKINSPTRDATRNNAGTTV